MSDSNRDPQHLGPPRKDSYTARELLRELFPGSHEELFGADAAGSGGEGTAAAPTLGLYPVADGRLALVHGGALAEFTPLSGQARRALHCDLCHHTRSPSEATIYRVVVAQRRSRYVTLCLNTDACQRRAGPPRLLELAGRIFPIEPGAEML